MGLSQEAFEKLLACLDPDRERAGERYEIVRRKLVKFFEWRGCVSPEDHADETIDRVGRKIDEGERIRVNDPSSYFYGVARNVLREYWEKRQRELAVLESVSSAGHPSEDPNESRRLESEQRESDRRLECLERCLEGFPLESRRLVVRYYWEEKRAKIANRKALAEHLGIPLNALRIRVHRLRGRLEDCVRECLREFPAG